MSVDKIQKYSDLSIKLLQRKAEIIEKERIVEEYLPDHNERITKLYNGYKRLGYYDICGDSISWPVTWEEYASEYKKIDEEMQGLIRVKPRNRAEEIEINTICEKIIAYYLLLSANRWNTIFAYKQVWRKKRIEFEDGCEDIMQKYRALGKIEDCDDKLKWINSTSVLFIRQMKLLDDHEKIITLEENAMDEFEHLIEVRENLIIAAKQLFLD